MTLSKEYGYFMLALFQAFHSAEEIATRLHERFPIVTGAVHEKIRFFPVFRMSADTFAIANIAVVALVVGLCPFVFMGRHWALKLATVVAVVEIMNGMGHIGAAVVAGAYYPGAVGAVGLIVAGWMFLKTRPNKRLR